MAHSNAVESVELNATAPLVTDAAVSTVDAHPELLFSPQSSWWRRLARWHRSPSPPRAPFSPECASPNYPATPVLTQPLSVSNMRDNEDTDDEDAIVVWHSRGRPRHWYPALLALLYYFGLTLTGPLMARFVLDLLCGEDMPSEECHSDDELHSRAVKYVLLISVVNSSVALLLVGFFGALSDRRGRKLVFVFVFAVSVLSACWNGMVSYTQQPVEMLFVSSVFLGLSHFPILNLALFAYAADTATEVAQRDEEQQGSKMQKFGYVEAGIFLGNLMGVFTGGVLYDKAQWLPFAVQAGVMLVCVLVSLAVPESLSPARRTTKLDWRKANTIGAVKLFGVSRTMTILAVVFVLQFMQLTGYGSVQSLFTVLEFSWDATTYGAWLAVVWISRAFFVAVYVPIMRRKLAGKCWVELVVSRIAVSCGAMAWLSYAFAPMVGWWLMFAATPLDGVMATATVSFRALFACSVSHQEQGLMLSAISSLELVERVISPTIVDSVYAATVDQFSGAVFVMGAGIQLLALFLMTFAKRDWQLLVKGVLPVTSPPGDAKEGECVVLTTKDGQANGTGETQWESLQQHHKASMRSFKRTHRRTLSLSTTGTHDTHTLSPATSTGSSSPSSANEPLTPASPLSPESPSYGSVTPSTSDTSSTTDSRTSSPAHAVAR